jgi:hypothetical protein
MPSLKFLYPTPIPGTTKHGMQMEPVFTIDIDKGVCQFGYRNIITSTEDATYATPLPENVLHSYSVPLTLEDIGGLMNIVATRAAMGGQTPADLIPMLQLTTQESVPSQVSINIDLPNCVVNGTVQFRASVFGVANTSVKWIVLDDGSGTVTDAGLYTAPATPGEYRIGGMSSADPSKVVVAKVLVSLV